MSRPFYESMEDTLAEMSVAKIASARWDCKLEKLKRAYPVDFAVVKNGKIVSFAEVKCRKYDMSKLDSMSGFMLSLHKWIAAKSLCRETGLPFILLVKANDGIWFMKTDMFVNDGIVIGGRHDRGDDQDVEPVVLLKADKFRWLAHHM